MNVSLLTQDGQLTTDAIKALTFLFACFSVAGDDGTPLMSLFTFLNMYNCVSSPTKWFGQDINTFPVDEAQGKFKWGLAQYRNKDEFLDFCRDAIQKDGPAWWIKVFCMLDADENLNFSQDKVDNLKQCPTYELNEFVFFPKEVWIKPRAFKGTGVEKIILSSGIERIGPKAFAECPALKCVKIPRSVGIIFPDAFDGTNNCVIDTTEFDAAHSYLKPVIKGKDVLQNWELDELPAPKSERACELIFEFGPRNMCHMCHKCYNHYICHGVTAAEVFQDPNDDSVVYLGINNGPYNDYLLERNPKIKVESLRKRFPWLHVGIEFLRGVMQLHAEDALNKYPKATKVKVFVFVEYSTADEFYRKFVQYLGPKNCIDRKKMCGGFNFLSLCKEDSFSTRLMSHYNTNTLDFVLGAIVNRPSSEPCFPGVKRPYSEPCAQGVKKQKR